MPDTTPRFGLPFPEGADGAAGPDAFEALALAVEEKLDRAGAQSKVAAIDAEQSTASTTFVELGTPDRVEDLVLVEDGLLVVTYSALWKRSVAGGPSFASLYVNEEQVKTISGTGAPTALGASTTEADYGWLRTLEEGLASVGGAGAASSVATGLFAAGACCIERLPAGTYDVSVRFRDAGGVSVSVKERILRAWVKAFEA